MGATLLNIPMYDLLAQDSNSLEEASIGMHAATHVQKGTWDE